MRLSYKGWFAFQSTPTSIGRSLWIRSCGDRNFRRATVRLGIDTLIANILVFDRLSAVCRVQIPASPKGNHRINSRSDHSMKEIGYRSSE